MVFLRKALAGSCNLGYTWPKDDAVAEVTSEHAAELLAIPYNDFTVVDRAPAAEPEPEPIEEPAPEATISEAPAPRTARKSAAKKAATSAPVEE